MMNKELIRKLTANACRPFYLRQLAELSGGSVSRSQPESLEFGDNLKEEIRAMRAGPKTILDLIPEGLIVLLTTNAGEFAAHRFHSWDGPD